MAFQNFESIVINHACCLIAGGSSKKKAIIGGVVGGVGALLIIALFVWFILSRRPKEVDRGNNTKVFQKY